MRLLARLSAAVVVAGRRPLVACRSMGANPAAGAVCPHEVAAMTEIAALSTPRALAARQAILAAALVATVLALGFVCARYLMFPGYPDHVSPSVAINAWGYWQGQPIYQLQNGAPRFAILFGPLSHLARVPAFALLGPSVLVSKLTGVAALTVTVGVLAWHFRRGPRAAGIDALLFLAAGLLAFAPWSFFVHGD